MPAAVETVGLKVPTCYDVEGMRGGLIGWRIRHVEKIKKQLFLVLRREERETNAQQRTET